MAWQMCKQPNGRYAIWSTVVDRFSQYNLTRDELIEQFMSSGSHLTREGETDPDLLEIEAIERRRIGKLVDAVDNGTIEEVRPYWSTWQEHLEFLEACTQPDEEDPEEEMNPEYVAELKQAIAEANEEGNRA